MKTSISSNGTSFDDWWIEVLTYAEQQGIRHIINENDPRSYECYYDDDYTPKEAVEEEASCCD
jgi:hypothetical protein